MNAKKWLTLYALCLLPFGVGATDIPVQIKGDGIKTQGLLRDGTFYTAPELLETSKKWTISQEKEALYVTVPVGKSIEKVKIPEEVIEGNRYVNFSYFAPKAGVEYIYNEKKHTLKLQKPKKIKKGKAVKDNKADKLGKIYFLWDPDQEFTPQAAPSVETPTKEETRANADRIGYKIFIPFQNYALYPHMTVQENLSFALKLRHVPKDEIARRTASAAETLGLTPYLKRLPKALSGGQRQRVALGRAIVRNPSVFLFDEPLSNLDAKMRVEMRAEIVRLHRRLGATMIYVTHDQTEAMTMGTRIVVMNGGRVQQVASPMEVYRHPANTFVASFIGTPPMNLFPPGVLDLGRVVGVRPENISMERMLPDGKVDADGGIVATVDLVEPLGCETLVHCVTRDRGIKVTVRALDVSASGELGVKGGDVVRLVPDMDKAVVFDR